MKLKLTASPATDSPRGPGDAVPLFNDDPAPPAKELQAEIHEIKREGAQIG